MKTKCFWVLAACIGAVLISGCVGTIDGRRKLGVPMVKDTVVGRYERSDLEVWAAAKNVLQHNGTLYSEDTIKNTLEAAVDTRTVWVRVEPEDSKVTRVTVQVRTKGGGADLALAGEIDKQIALRLATGNLAPTSRPAQPR